MEENKKRKIPGLDKIDPNRVYNYELVGKGKDHRGTYLINSVTKVYDEKEGKYLDVRLSSTESSPYVDEQSETARATNQGLKFTKGKLSVSGREAHKLRYLQVIDNNIVNDNIRTKPTFRFRLIDEEANAQTMAERKLKVLKIQTILANSEKDELLSFLQSEYNFTPKTETKEELLVKAMAYAEKDPDFVIGNFKTENTKLKATIKSSFAKQVIKQHKNHSTGKTSLIWGDNDTEIHVFNLSEGEGITDAIMEWVDKDSKEAKAFVKKLQTK